MRLCSPIIFALGATVAGATIFQPMQAFWYYFVYYRQVSDVNEAPLWTVRRCIVGAIFGTKAGVAFLRTAVKKEAPLWTARRCIAGASFGTTAGVVFLRTAVKKEAPLWTVRRCIAGAILAAARRSEEASPWTARAVR